MSAGVLVGVDIGGTKSAVCTWSKKNGIREIEVFATKDPGTTLEQIAAAISKLKLRKPFLLGIACGSPLDSKLGIIQSPPNLPGWDDVRIVGFLRKRFRCRASLMNDANANALAEWRFGAGRGSRSMMFLTAGTGMGAGIVLDGRLYEGANGNAGEVGHMRLAARGPVGYGKRGSFEGFCSGGAIPDLVRFLPTGQRPRNPFAWRKRHPTLQSIADAARDGDPVARTLFLEVGRRLGSALAAFVDILNPDRIIIGSLYVRCQDLIEAPMREALEREALPSTLAACSIVPAKLGRQVGNYGAICVALHASGKL